MNTRFEFLSNMSQYNRFRTLNLNKTLTKKKKFRRFLKKKDDKEYNQHQYVDAYAENMILGRVNDDCLTEIFMYLSPFERPKVALVCKRWKQALDYSWIDVKKLELTQWRYDEMCPSYMNKYPTMNGSLEKDLLFRFLKSLLDKCGHHLTELDVTAYGHCNILPLISKSCRNLVKLRLKLNDTIDDINTDTFEHLSKLKVLKIIFQSFDPSHDMPIILITLLRNIAKTLTELSLSYWAKGSSSDQCSALKKISHLIPELKALKTMELFGFEIDNNLFMYLRNSQILVCNHDEVLRSGHGGLHVNLYDLRYPGLLISPYKRVTQLELLCHVTNDYLYNIANCMKQLQSLGVSCERVTDPGIIAISKMNNLFNLNLMGHSDVTESSIILLENFKILCLPYSNKITDYSVTKILENSPNIKEFHIRGSAITSKFTKKAEEISRNRQIKLKLGIQPTIPAGIEQYESPYLDIFIPDYLPIIHERQRMYTTNHIIRICYKGEKTVL